MAEEFKPQYTFTDDRLNELKQLFPEAWEDGVFNVDTLKTLIGEYSTDNNIKEHFGLNWVGKQDARKIAAKPPTGTLKPCPGEGVNEDNTENVFIEGENLEVLKILRKSYMGKIKMIYIDPPYNTGNDFIYNDTFADSTEDYLRKTGDKSDEGLLVSNPKSSGKYHANWLSFMYPRLRLAKDLLKEDGLMFVSIDSYEIENLKLLMNEIFGEENSENFITWRRRHNQPNDKSKVIGKVSEYILVFTKNLQYLKSKSTFYGVPLSEKRISDYTNPDDDPNGKWSTNPWKAAQGRGGSTYKITTPTGIEYDETWYGNETTFKKLLEENKVHWTDGGAGYPRTKIYLKDAMIEGQTAINWFNFDKFGSNQDASSELETLFEGKKVFDNPKPTKLMSALQNICFGKEDELFMDFFAGSGSSLHALLSDNFSVPRNCKFIGVQIPEEIKPNDDISRKAINFLESIKKPLLISELTKERVRRAISSIDKTKGFKVFKLDKSTIYKWQDFIPQQDGIIPDLFSKLELAFKNPLLDGTQTQDFITEVILQEGFPLTAKQEEAISGVFKITHEWVPYTLYVSMLQSFKNIDLDQLQLQGSDHFICLDKAFESNDALKQAIDNQCKLLTI